MFVNDPSVQLGNGDPKPEIMLDVVAGLSVDTSGNDPIPTSLTLDLFGLELSATDNLVGEQPGTRIAGMLGLDIEGDPNNHLPLADIGNRSFGEIFQASLEADVAVDLTLEAAITANLPSVAVDLIAGWDFSVETDVNGQIQVDVGEPTVGFQDIRLDLGDFLGKYIGPAIDTVNEILDPVRPVLDLLNAEVPGISQLSEMAGQGPVTMLDLAFIRNPEQGERVRKFINVVTQISDVIESIADASGAGEVIINFGDLNFGGGENSVDLRDPSWNTQDLGTVFDDASAGFESVLGQVGSSGNADMGKAVSGLQRESSSQGLGGLGINLALLEPANIFKLLIGQTADVITWDIPRFDLLFEWSQSFRVFPVPPISVEVGFNISAFMDLSVGYDTRGLQTGNFVDGFFFGDLADVVVGADIDEFGFGLGVTLAALLDIGVASAGIEGEIRGDVFANWRDTDNNGKMYLDEIANIVSQDGIECLFDIHGSVRAIVRLVWEVLFFSGSVDIIDVEIFSFDNEGLCPKVEAAHVADGSAGDGNRNILPGGATAAAGTLIVHAGSFAGLRQPGKSSDTSEFFTVRQFAPGVFEVEGMGLTQSFAAVTGIYFDGGAGSDTLELEGLNGNEVDVPVTAYGGDMADQLEGGIKDDVLDGGGGADVIDGHDGDDQISGGDGGDTLTGGDGKDTITGGNDNDTITGGDGKDDIEGGAGDDLIEGQGNSDKISGGTGEDEIYGGYKDAPTGEPDAGDEIFGNARSDIIYGRDGDDTIDGGSGHDFLYGEDGKDVIYGQSGHDWIEGGNNDDPMLDGGKGNDLVIGGPGSDVLLGNWGNDVIFGHLIADNSSTYGEHIEGGPDDDFICGTEGADLIYGGTGEVNFGAGLGTGLSHVLDLGQFNPVEAGGYMPLTCDDEPVWVEPPPAIITGQKFKDLSGDGVHDPNEPGYNGWTIEVYDDVGDFVDTVVTTDLDLSMDGLIDPITESGLYAFDDLDPGTYTVIEVQQSGHQQTLPAGPSYVLTIDGGETAEDIDFGNQPLSSIHGIKFDDIDRDGARDPDEPGVAGVVIYLDENNSGFLEELDGLPLEPYTITMADDPDTPEDETGMYWLEDVTPGEQIVREVLPVGVFQTFPTAAEDFKHVVEVGPGEVLADVNFGNSPPRGDIHGQKFEDLNGNGRRDQEEVGLNGWTIELVAFRDDGTVTVVDTQITHSVDLNLDGQINPLTEQGLYAFVGVDPGSYLVREVQQPGWVPTTPPEQDVQVGSNLPVAILFGNRPVLLDFGDAPDRPYPTLRGSNGARHAIARANPTLGELIDIERDGQPHIAALGDDSNNLKDEDGIVFLDQLDPGGISLVQVTVTGADGYLNAWIDFNRDGDWADTFSDGTTEQIFFDRLLAQGVHTLEFQVPKEAARSRTFSRFRLSTQRDLSFVGLAADGEVEDHRLRIGRRPQVVGHHVFYNNSNFDGKNPEPNAKDDGAIAPDKTALLPGQTATSANYTSYFRGINGIMVDLIGLPTALPGETVPAIGIDSFEFRVGNSNDLTTWNSAPRPSSITVRPGAGDGGSDRVTVLWEDHAIAKQWLQVTVLAGDATGLSLDDVFYFGNAVGESGNSTIEAKVDAFDMLAARNNQRSFIDPAPIDFFVDFNHDERVNALDMLVARNNVTHFLTALRLITAATTDDPAGKAHAAGEHAAIDCDVHGYKWNDENRNGVRDEGEPGLAGVTIYVDLNDNGQLDPGEPSTVTGEDDPNTPEDETGFYCLNGLAAPLPGDTGG